MPSLPLDDASALLAARIHRHHGSVISVNPLINAGKEAATASSGGNANSKSQLLGVGNNQQQQTGTQMARHKSTVLKRLSAVDREANRLDTKAIANTSGGLSKLKKLIIAFNNITTIPNFLSLTSLEYLAVNNNPLTQLPGRGSSSLFFFFIVLLHCRHFYLGFDFGLLSFCFCANPTDRFIASITHCTHLDASSSSLRLLSSSWNNLANLTSLNLSVRLLYNCIIPKFLFISITLFYFKYNSELIS
jgi:hypothetical protein